MRPRSVGVRPMDSISARTFSCGMPSSSRDGSRDTRRTRSYRNLAGKYMRGTRAHNICGARAAARNMANARRTPRGVRDAPPCARLELRQADDVATDAGRNVVDKLADAVALAQIRLLRRVLLAVLRQVGVHRVAAPRRAGAQVEARGQSHGRAVEGAATHRSTVMASLRSSEPEPSRSKSRYANSTSLAKLRGARGGPGLHQRLHARVRRLRCAARRAALPRLSWLNLAMLYTNLRRARGRASAPRAARLRRAVPHARTHSRKPILPLLSLSKTRHSCCE
jgi:hypothetical protein